MLSSLLNLCTLLEDCSVVEELKNAFKTVLPICQGCRSTKEPVTRGKYKHPTLSNSKASASKKARLFIIVIDVVNFNSIKFSFKLNFFLPTYSNSEMPFDPKPTINLEWPK